MKKFIALITGLLVLSITTITIFFGSRYIFKLKSRSKLSTLAYEKLIEMDRGTGPELALAKQMSHSPLIIKHLSNPDDEEIRNLAFTELKVFQDLFASHRTFWISDKDLRYYSNMEFIYNLDKSDPGNAWYEATLRSGDEYQFYVDYDLGLKKTFMWINAIVYDDYHKPIGIAGTGVELSDFVTSMYAHLESGITMYMYNAKGEISGSTNLDYLENKTPITDVMPELSALKNRTPSETEFFSTKKGEYVIQPLENVGWTVVMFVPFTLSSFIENAALPLAFILIAFLITLIIFTIHRIISPLLIVKNAINEIADGEADLSRRLDTDIRTPFKVIPQIAEGFNSFVSNLQSIMSDLKASEKTLSSIANEMKGNAEETGTSIENISKSIASVRDQMDSQISAIGETSEVVQEVSGGITSLSTLIETQAESIGETSASVEDLIGNISQLNTSMEDMAKSFGTLDSEARNGVEKQNRVNERISQIEAQSQMLQEANMAIASIAEQTNLLAMNAAIEAAHAGEAGKGFAVVADEIRKLSETSSSQSHTIGEQLNAIQSGIAEIVNASKESSTAFATVTTKIHETDAIVLNMRNALEAQNENSKQVINSLHQMDENTNSVKSASEKMAEGNKRVLDEMRQLQESVQIFGQNVASISAGADTITQNGTELTESFRRMSESVVSIGNEIERFKV